MLQFMSLQQVWLLIEACIFIIITAGAMSAESAPHQRKKKTSTLNLTTHGCSCVHGDNIAGYYLSKSALAGCLMC